MNQTHHVIDYVELTVRDLARAKAFYASAFGWTFTDYGPTYAGIRSPEGGVGGMGEAESQDVAEAPTAETAR